MPGKTKILVVRYRFLGDTILTVPFLKRLREMQPEAHIAVLIGPQSGELLINCPYIDELIEFDTTRFHKYDSGKSQKKSFWKYAWALRKQHFDIAYILKRSFSSAALAFLAGIKERIGFNTEGRGFLLTQKVPFDLKRHEVLNFLEHLPAPFKEPPPKADVLFWPTEAEQQKAQDLLKNVTGKKIIVHAPAAHPAKMWKLEAWCEVVKGLKDKNFKIVFSGAPSDDQYYKQIEEQLGFKADLNLCKLPNTLRENVAIYALCDLAVCVDSGPMHLAAAVGVPVVALFGPSDPDRWRPWSDKYKVLRFQSEQTLAQIETLEQDLTPVEVLEASLSLLNDL